ncbi:hypothetical protein HYH02_007564 [Chlamydomonas schloesseri]|uniref:Uncharacterized protein n=1 Tax=Chlamydomonas schloesseri TaxID=2026947 RepID=A0A835WI94_9CHLO|nr:hypothetical protein HYH02_007564 [Chlamydomonas schloesseri]|eukprot:KAG2447646.1 hypothetical protein HYH02_007564 [Chlamydomonas schloesseri]
MSVQDEEQQVLDTYGATVRACLGKLRSIWRQVGKAPEDQRAVVQLITDEALAAWSKGVEAAENERSQIKLQIQQYSAEISSIRAELDDGGVSGSTEAAETSEGGEATLLRSLESLKATLQLWRTKRAARMQAYEALMAVHMGLKRQLGLPHTEVTDADISTGALEYLNMENGKLEEEKGRRLSRAEAQLDVLRAICRELGEDAAVAAAEVHPALRAMSAEKESAEMLGAVYRLTGVSGASGGGGGSLAAADGELDLSDACFERLAGKIREMERLKVEREAQSRDVLEMLGGLWTALDIPEDAPERGMVHKMLAVDRPQRLHKRTLDKCMAEVNRLEGCKAQAMRDLALSKARELEQLCISSRISPPHTGPLLAELDKPGQMTQVLTKLVRLVAEVAALAARRGPILAQVSDLLAAAADSAWLRAYNQDENRYKGRDASRNMQRAIKAGKLRERLGGMMEGLAAALAEWEAEEGGPFLYDEQVLQDTVLKTVEIELEQLALEKQPKPKASAASAAAGASKPPAGRPGTAAGRPSMGGAGVPRPTISQSTSFSTSTATHHDGRPMLTPRGVGDGAAAYRRMSMAAAAPASSRDGGVYHRMPSTGGKAGGAMARSGDFALGSLRAAAAAAAHGGRGGGISAGGALAPESSTASMSSSALMPPPAMTPPPHHRTPGGGHGMAGASPMHTGGKAGAATGAGKGAGAMAPPTTGGGSVSVSVNNGSAVKNSAQDLFRRYLGDADTAKATPTSKPTPAPVSPAGRGPAAKLTFSMAGAGGAGGADDYDDGVDDVVRAKCDTPKSTARSGPGAAAGKSPLSLESPTQATASALPANAASSLVSPTASKQSRIPRLRL